MKEKTSKIYKINGWCFALVNKRICEIHFATKNGKSEILVHTYVKREEYKTKIEQKMIDNGIKKYHFTWKNGIYKQQNLTT